MGAEPCSTAGCPLLRVSNRNTDSVDSFFAVQDILHVNRYLINLHLLSFPFLPAEIRTSLLIL